MRTTLELDDEVLESAKSLANARGNTLGQVISELLRLALRQQSIEIPIRNGVPLFVPKNAAPRPDLDLVNSLRDEP